jgi:spore coat protein H
MTVPTPARIPLGVLATLALVTVACQSVKTPPAAPAAAPLIPAQLVVAPPPAPTPAPSAAPSPTAAASVPAVPVSLLPPREAVASPTSLAAAAKKKDPIFGLGRVHQIEVALSAAEWSVLQRSSPRGGAGTGGTDYTQADGRLIHVGSGFGGYFPWGHADVRLGGEEFRNVGLRYRGNYSFTSSSAAAPLRASLKLKLDTYGTKGSWAGIKTLNFNAGNLDTTLTREALAFALFRAAGVPAPRTAYAEIRFTVPGVFDNTRGGYYVMIENVNRAFLKEALPPGQGLLMKPEGTRGGIQAPAGTTWASYKGVLRPDREATAHEQQRVMEFAQLISQTDVALFRARIGSYLDVEEFLRFVAINAFIENWDSYLGGSHNYYLYLDSSDDKFRFIPWDEDLAMGTRGGGQGINLAFPMQGNQPLIYWLLEDPAVQARYRAVLKELSLTVLSRAELMKFADTVETAIGIKGAAPRIYLEGRANFLVQLVAAWDKLGAP